MVVSRNDDVSCTAAGLVHTIRRRRPAARHAVAPRVTSEALPYCLLRRMSTDDHGAAPLWAGAVIVGGLISSELGARQCAEVTRRRLLAVVLALASRESARTRRAYRN